MTHQTISLNRVDLLGVLSLMMEAIFRVRYGFVNASISRKKRGTLLISSDLPAIYSIIE